MNMNFYLNNTLWYLIYLLLMNDDNNYDNIFYLNKGAYGIVMKLVNPIINTNIVIKQIYVYYIDDADTNLSHEVKLTKVAYNSNPDIFINIIKDELSIKNFAKKINMNIPLIDEICLNEFGYIYMEYMDDGDLFHFNKQLNLDGILGCYINGIYLLHNKLGIIHGDITPTNILVKYIGINYRQKIIYNDKDFYIDTDGYSFKITDFGLAENIDKTFIQVNKQFLYRNFLYRDYLLLFYIYCNKHIYNNYDKYKNIIEMIVNNIKNIFNENYTLNIDKIEFMNICNITNVYFEINLNDEYLYKIPRILLLEYLDKNI